MIDLMLGIEAAPRARARSSPIRRDGADRRAGARGALLAARRRHERKTADPRPRARDLIENPFNQLLDHSGPAGFTSFTWDGNGNQTARTSPAESTAYSWDARDRLTGVALPDGTTAAYGYDTENLRVSMDDSGGTRRIVLDGLEEYGEVDEATGELHARFDHDPTRIDALLAQETAAEGHAAMLTDALGSVYGLADDAATLRARYGYDVYGARSASLEEIGTRWGFTGRRIDREKIGYLRNRSLDGRTGSFLAADPIGMADGPNRYLFASARPTVLQDPLGLAGMLVPSIGCPRLAETWVQAGRARLEATLAEFDTAAASVRISYWQSALGDSFVYELVPPLEYSSVSFECDCSLPLCGEHGFRYDELEPIRINPNNTAIRGPCGSNNPLAGTLLHEWTHHAVAGMPGFLEELEWEVEQTMPRTELIAQTIEERAFGKPIGSQF